MGNAQCALNSAVSTAASPLGKLELLAQSLAAGDALPLDFAAVLADAKSAAASGEIETPLLTGDTASTAAALDAVAVIDTTSVVDAGVETEMTAPSSEALLALTGDGPPPLVAPPPGLPLAPVAAPATARTDATTPLTGNGTAAGGNGTGNSRALAFLASLQAQRRAPQDGLDRGLPTNDSGDAESGPAGVAKIAVPTGKTDGLPALAAEANTRAGNSAGSPASGVVPTHAAALGGHNTPLAATAVTPPTVPVPIHDPRWASEVGQKMVWMVKQDVQSAQLSVSPAHLGPIDITLNVGSDGATALFHSANAEVRDILEAALPRLREMMGQAGIQLADARVGAQNQGQSDAQQHGARRFAANERGGEAILLPESAVNQDMRAGGRARAGLVDLFA